MELLPLIHAQMADYCQVLERIQPLVDDGLPADAVEAFLAFRSACYARTAERDERIGVCLNKGARVPGELVASYTRLVEDVAEAERHLAVAATAMRDALGGQLAELARGMQALQGYRPVAEHGSLPVAVTQRI